MYMIKRKAGNMLCCDVVCCDVVYLTNFCRSFLQVKFIITTNLAFAAALILAIFKDIFRFSVQSASIECLDRNNGAGYYFPNKVHILFIPSIYHLFRLRSEIYLIIKKFLKF